MSAKEWWCSQMLKVLDLLIKYCWNRKLSYLFSEFLSKNSSSLSVVNTLVAYIEYSYTIKNRMMIISCKSNNTYNKKCFYNNSTVSEKYKDKVLSEKKKERDVTSPQFAQSEKLYKEIL